MLKASKLLLTQHKYKKEHQPLQLLYDMYPQYWTSSIGGILMKYSYKFKRQCVELYRQGKWPETPKDITEKIFHNTIRVWVRIEDKCGPEAIKT